MKDLGETIMVATVGEVARTDSCAACGWPMLYRVKDATASKVLASFCGNEKCLRWLIEIAE